MGISLVKPHLRHFFCFQDDSFDNRVSEDIFQVQETSAVPAEGVTPTTPVQFCTSPPVDVHKPRQHSASPPAKLFHFSAASQTASTFHRPEAKRDCPGQCGVLQHQSKGDETWSPNCQQLKANA